MIMDLNEEIRISSDQGALEDIWKSSTFQALNSYWSCKEKYRMVRNALRYCVVVDFTILQMSGNVQKDKSELVNGRKPDQRYISYMRRSFHGVSVQYFNSTTLFQSGNAQQKQC